MGMGENIDDDIRATLERVMERVHARWEASGMTLDQLGQKMGYPAETARKSAWQFLQKTKDPRLSMLKRCAKAFDIQLTRLLKD